MANEFLIQEWEMDQDGDGSPVEVAFWEEYYSTMQGMMDFWNDNSVPPGRERTSLIKEDGQDGWVAHRHSIGFVDTTTEKKLELEDIFLAQSSSSEEFSSFSFSTSSSTSQEPVGFSSSSTSSSREFSSYSTSSTGSSVSNSSESSTINLSTSSTSVSSSSSSSSSTVNLSTSSESTSSSSSTAVSETSSSSSSTSSSSTAQSETSSTEQSVTSSSSSSTSLSGVSSSSSSSSVGETQIECVKAEIVSAATNSATYVDITGSSISITLSTTSHIMVFFSGEFFKSGGGASDRNLDVVVNVDGTDLMTTFSRTLEGTGDHGIVGCVVRTTATLIAGTYTVKLRWRIDGNTANVANGTLIAVAMSDNSGDIIPSVGDIVVSDTTTNTVLEDIDGLSDTFTAVNETKATAWVSVSGTPSVASTSDVAVLIGSEIAQNIRDHSSGTDIGNTVVNVVDETLTSGVKTAKGQHSISTGTLTNAPAILGGFIAESDNKIIPLETVSGSDTTTNTSIEDMDGITVDVTIDQTSHIVATMVLDASGSAITDANYSININGVDGPEIQRSHQSINDDGSITVVASTNSKLIPGTYTVKGRWRTSAGTLTGSNIVLTAFGCETNEALQSSSSSSSSTQQSLTSSSSTSLSSSSSSSSTINLSTSSESTSTSSQSGDDLSTSSSTSQSSSSSTINLSTSSTSISTSSSTSLSSSTSSRTVDVTTSSSSQSGVSSSSSSTSSSVEFSSFTSSSSSSENLVDPTWVNLTGVSLIAGGIQADAGSGAAWDTGCNSAERLFAGGAGSIEWTSEDNNTGAFFGISHNKPDNDYDYFDQVDFAFRQDNRRARVHEFGSQVYVSPNNTVTTGTKLKINIDYNGVVTFLIDDVVKFTSSVTVTLPVEVNLGIKQEEHIVNLPKLHGDWQ